MSLVNIFRGKRGVKGADAANGLGVSDINYPLLSDPVLSTLHDNNLNDVTWTRAGEALIQDRYGNFKFISGDDFTNHIPYSEDFTQWDDPLNRWTLISNTISDPLGGNNGAEIELDATISSGDFCIEDTLSGLTSGLTYTVGFYFKVISGAITGLEILAGGETFTVKTDLSASWELVKRSISIGSTGTIFSITPIGAAGARVGVFAAMFVNGSNLPDYIKTTGSAVTVTNNLTPARSNEKGYLFEGQKQNLVIFAENLTASPWSASGGNVQSYSSAGPFGDFFQNILVNCTSQITTINHDSVTLTNDEEYTVSIICLVLSNVTDIKVSLGGGDAVSFGELPTESFQRLNVKATASTLNELDLSVTSPTSTGQVIITAIQVETGDLSSYIRTASQAINRPEDDLNEPFEIGDPAKPWGVYFELNELDDNNDTKYIFSNGNHSTSEFSCYVQNQNIIIKAGSTTFTFTDLFDAEDITFSYNGTDIKAYKDGVLNQTIAGIISVDSIEATLYIGSDETTGNALDAFMKNLYFYDGELTASDALYMTRNK